MARLPAARATPPPASEAVWLTHRGPVRAGEGRLRAGRVRGAELDRVAPARDPEPVRAGRAGGDPLPGREAGGAKKGGAGLIPLTVPEVRKLILRLVWERLTPAEQAL